MVPWGVPLRTNNPGLATFRGSKISGTVDYVIEGRPTAGVYTAFVDFTAAISLDQLSISSVYIDPEAN